jgi:hypothetical protein
MLPLSAGHNVSTSTGPSAWYRPALQYSGVYDGKVVLMSVMAWNLSLDLIAFLFVLLSVLFCTFLGRVSED